MTRPTSAPRPDERRRRRRRFLTAVSTAAAGLAAPPAQAAAPGGAPASRALPSIQLGPHRVSRLVAGWNPIGGYSYLGPHMNRHMKEYFTPDHIVDYLLRCEQAGITAHQFSRPETMAPVLRRAREQGCRMNFICLYAGGDAAAINTVVAETRPIAIVHHGGVTDRLFREGKWNEVRQFVLRVKEAGVLAGVSAHNPDNIKRIADEGWPVDLFMCCFYYLTRSQEELARMPPVVTEQIGYAFFRDDPLRMTAVMREVDQPCLGFKILAAGRKCQHKRDVEEAFRFAFEHIKPRDGVIVGMYPRFQDEMTENAEYVRRFGV